MKRYYRKPHRLLSTRRWEKRTRKRLIWTIVLSLALIYAATTWVLPNLIWSLSFLNQLKPVTKPTTPLSESIILSPPLLNIPYEATSTSSINISGFTLPASQVEIYVDDTLSKTATAAKDGSFKAEKISLSLGTNRIYGKVVDEKGNSSLPSKVITITYSNEKPKLEITEPMDGQLIKGGDKKVSVRGTTDPDNRLQINDSKILVGPQGEFLYFLPLSDGDNNLTITATNSSGNITTIIRKVTYQPE